jgi:hypothetical protein
VAREVVQGEIRVLNLRPHGAIAHKDTLVQEFKNLK